MIVDTVTDKIIKKSAFQMFKGVKNAVRNIVHAHIHANKCKCGGKKKNTKEETNTKEMNMNMNECMQYF